MELPCCLLINAMTGGAAEVESMNGALAEAAAHLGLPMAVGSQVAGMREPEVAQSYRIVRQVNPQGVILANVSTSATVEEARAAVEMIDANLLQIHLNAPQELVMAEGDRGFRGQLRQIAALVDVMPVPVVVKECGFGMSRETARQLYDAGVRAVDVSGRGGTNFAWIEGQRQDLPVDPGIEQWGIPTAATLAEVAALSLPGVDIVASGGVRYGSDCAKALALGASVVGVAGAALRAYQQGRLQAYLEGLVGDLRCALLLSGARSVAEMRLRPVVITGETGQWCRLRGVPLETWAQR